MECWVWPSHRESGRQKDQNDICTYPEDEEQVLGSACESVWSGLLPLSVVPGRCWETSDCQHEGKRHLPGLAAQIPCVCRGAGQPPVQRSCLACSPGRTEPPAFLLGAVPGTRALPTLNKIFKNLSAIYQNSSHRMNFMVVKSNPISRTEVQHWAGPEFTGQGGDNEDLVQDVLVTFVLLIIKGGRAWLSGTTVCLEGSWINKSRQQ